LWRDCHIKAVEVKWDNSEKTFVVDEFHQPLHTTLITQNTMNRTLLTAAVIVASVSMNLGAATAINGSGATFPAPLYLRWASDFKNADPNVTVNYQGIGSGAGVDRKSVV
jgi:ABC-type phosphate transport system substrate-binding protein